MLSTRARISFLVNLAAVLSAFLVAVSCSEGKEAAPPVVDVPTRVATNTPKEVAKEALVLHSADGETWSIGKVIEDEILEQKNIVISTSEFGVEFGPIDGFDSGSLILGWNDRKRLLYVATTSAEIRTVDGLGVGLRKTAVLERLGPPIAETERLLRYQNTDTELVGILFYLNQDGLVTKIVLFSYV